RRIESRNFSRSVRRPFAATAGARHERATVCDLRPVGVGRRQPAVDVAASSWPAVAVGFVRKLDPGRARPLHAGEGLSPRRRRAAAGRLTLDLSGMGRETRSDPCNSGFGRWGRPPCRYARPQRCKRATGSRPGAGAMTPAPKLTPTEKAAKELAQLSDAEWMAGQVRRRAPHHSRFVQTLSRTFARRDDRGGI